MVEMVEVGGHIIFLTDSNLHTLQDIRYHKNIRQRMVAMVVGPEKLVDVDVIL